MRECTQKKFRYDRWVMMQSKMYPNIHSCIILFSLVALFETAFLALTIQVWDPISIVVYGILVFALQIAACAKAICVWRVRRHSAGVAYISCAVITGLMMYLMIEIFIGIASVYEINVFLSINPIVIALVDALLSMGLLYSLKSWLEVVLSSKPFQLSRQMQNHFLFNALNTSVSVVRKKPEIAEDNLEQLAGLFRQLLSLDVYTNLEEELALVRHYLEVEKYRLEERLHVNWLLDPETDITIKIPALILQPLVENALRYGVKKIVTGGTIAIALRTVESRLIIQVRNPVDNSKDSDLLSGNRIAQINIERRLQLIYENDFSFRREQSETEYCATIDIPIRQSF